MNKYQALRAINSSVITLCGNDAFDIDGNSIQYDEATVQAYIDAHAYIAKRVAEYPPIGDQLDALWKGGDAATEMLAKVQAVKAKYPKVTA